MKNSRLWTNIKNFTLDDPDCEFSFSQRLARDNNWSLAFSQQVILEYKKFMYLCCVGYGELTPSDAVDQAWHLHLTYTKSYWIAFCEDTLGKQIHHNPTQGGSEEKVNTPAAMPIRLGHMKMSLKKNLQKKSGYKKIKGLLS